MRDVGIIKLYTLKDVSESGRMPVEKLVLSCCFYYAKVTTGVTRRYAALGANRNYNAVVRCWNAFPIDDEVKYAIDETGTQYRIDYAEPVYDQDAVELTLVRLEEFYDVADETSDPIQPAVST